MKARSLGAFLVTFFGLGYLLGEFEGFLDFTIALGVAAAVGIAVAMWAESDEGKEPPDVFDERATRRAVRRGVARTSLSAVVWVLVGLAVVYTITGAWQTRGGRSEHFELVATHGFNAANAGFKPAAIRGCCPRGLRSIELELGAEPRSASGLGTPARVRLELDLRGRLADEVFDLPTTGVAIAGSSGGLETKQSLRKLLERLPDPLVATTVVELARPLKPVGLYTLLARHGVAYPDSFDVAVYLQSREGAFGGGPEGRFFENRVSWPSPSLAQFQQWVKQLRGSDDRLLDGLRLPSSKRLHVLAADPFIHGFILDRATPRQLRGLLAEGIVESVSIGEVAFALGTAS